MRVCGAISVAVVSFLAVSVAAQESLPASYRERLATLDRLKSISLRLLFASLRINVSMSDARILQQLVGRVEFLA